MILVPLFDFKFLHELAATGVGTWIGGTSPCSPKPMPLTWLALAHC